MSENEFFFTFYNSFLLFTQMLLNFALAIICGHTLKEIQIFLRKSLANCQMLRWISKAAAMQELPSDLSFLMFFFILNMTLAYLLKWISTLSHTSMFVWPLQTLSATFLSETGDFFWDCLVKGYEPSDNWVNWFNVVICSLSFNHIYCSSYFSILCLSL